MKRAGFLDNVGVRVLLNDAGAERLSGTLRVTHEGGEMEIYLTHGEIYYAATRGEAPIEELLADAGVITAEQRDTLGVNTARGRYLGRALVGDRPGVDHQRIRSFVRGRTVEQVRRMLELRHGKFLFLAHEHHAAGVIDASPVATVLRAADQPAEDPASGLPQREPSSVRRWIELPEDRARPDAPPRRAAPRQTSSTTDVRPVPLRRFGSGVAPAPLPRSTRPTEPISGAGNGPRTDDAPPAPTPEETPVSPAEPTPSDDEAAPTGAREPAGAVPLPSRRAAIESDEETPRPAPATSGAGPPHGPAPAEPAERGDTTAARSSVRRRALERLIRSIRS
ncbi:MAG: DUF4388 domain-containing protein [Actinomycetota bacterium]|nr:DUF4388 domain-containing protein [Actinomycetota bacterium]